MKLTFIDRRPNETARYFDEDKFYIVNLKTKAVYKTTDLDHHINKPNYVKNEIDKIKNPPKVN